VTKGNSLLHDEETVAFGGAGYQGIQKRPDAKADVAWQIAVRPGKSQALKKENAADALLGKAEKIKAAIRAKVEHPFRVFKIQFVYKKVHYRGLNKNTAQLVTLFALANFMNGVRQTDGSAGMSAFETPGKCPVRAQKQPNGCKKWCRF
jgi:IS5 family transposase